jgi:hypothetical protein
MRVNGRLPEKPKMEEFGGAFTAEISSDGVIRIDNQKCPAFWLQVELSNVELVEMLFKRYAEMGAQEKAKIARTLRVLTGEINPEHDQRGQVRGR